MDTPRTQVLFGAAYYHEYQPSPRLKTDLDLMVDAGFSVIRVGESVWTTWEPEEGRFDLDWLQPVLDGAHERGIKAILGTPTYAAPPWLSRRYPEIAAETATGTRMPWGGRQEIDYSHPAFRFHAERIIRKIIARYADHPAVIGYQVDNEPGMLVFHNHGVFQRFVDELRHTYGDVETLNEAWGLVYWSHRLSTWADLWTPDGNFQPQYDLAWRRFQAKLTTEFIGWQAGIVREYARPDQFVTTCIAYERPGVDDANLTRALDVTAGNPYYAMQDALAVPYADSLPQGWTTSGAWSLFASADRMFASKQAPFLITETNAGAIGGPSVNFPAYDGQWRQAAWAFVARGAEMIEYWHWHTNHFGTETYWIGILPHDQQPGRVYGELARLGRDFQVAGSAVVGLKPDARVGLLYSARAKWGLAFQSSFPSPTAAGPSDVANMDRRSYHTIFDAFYRGTFEAGVPARLLHDEHLLDADGAVLIDPAELAAELAGADRAGAAGRRQRLAGLAAGLCGGRWPSRARPANRVRGRGRSGSDRGQAGEARRRRGGALPGVLEPERSAVAGGAVRRVRPIGRRRRNPVGGRVDRRWRRGAGRLRAPALRQVPGSGQPRARRRPDHHGRNRPRPRLRSRPRALARTRCALGRTAGLGHRPLGDQPGRTADPRAAQLELGFRAGRSRHTR